MAVTIGHSEPGFEDPVGLMVACHRRIERFLAVLVDLAVRRGGHALTSTERTAMEVALTYFHQAAPHHTADEERGLFPALAQAGGKGADDLRDLERDHRRAEQLHEIVHELGLSWLKHRELDEWDCRAFQSALADLSALYRDHIGIEEERVFPRARKMLSRGVLERIGQDMASRRGVTYIPPTVQLKATAS